jgi:hypothetical protein
MYIYIHTYLYVYEGDDCPPVWGHCGHALHMQCVMKWLESQQNTRYISIYIYIYA